MMARAPHNLSKLGAPAGACAALALAVGVWLIPGSLLDPHPPKVPVSKPMPPATPPAAPAPPVVQHDWTALAQKLDRIREPIVATDPIADGTGGENAPPVPTMAPPVALNWQYEGYVVEGEQVVALVRIASIQRFVFVDQEIKDPSIAGYGRAVIKSIEPDRIVVTVGDHDVEVARTQQEPTSRLNRPQPATAGRLE